MVTDAELFDFAHMICGGDHEGAVQALKDSTDLAVARLAVGATRSSAQEFFLEGCGVIFYAGHTGLHVAAAAYDVDLCRALVRAGADVHAVNRRGAQPLHEAVQGGPGSPTWDPAAQVAVIEYLIEAGADPDAVAAGGVTPLHRAVRNRCSAAVGALLDAGADPQRTNDSGSTPAKLAGLTTGRGGTGSPDAKAEQAEIRVLLEAVVDDRA